MGNYKNTKQNKHICFIKNKLQNYNNIIYTRTHLSCSSTFRTQIIILKKKNNNKKK